MIRCEAYDNPRARWLLDNTKVSKIEDSQKRSRLSAFQEITITEEQAAELRRRMDSPIIEDESGFPIVMIEDRKTVRGRF